MRILAISDIHCNCYMLEKVLTIIKDYDLIIICGDFDCPRAVDMLAGHRVLAVSGNMDYFDVIVKLEKFGILIEDNIRRVGEYAFIGIGMGELSLEEIKHTEKTIIISHYPPYGTKVDIAFTGEHIGSHLVRDIVERLKPLVCLCGHVHEARGVDNIGETLVLNPGPLSKGYYAILELPSCRYSLESLNL